MRQLAVATKDRATPSRLCVGRLRTVGDVCRELGSLYRAARRGEVGSADAARLAYLLTSLRTAIEAGDLERRLEALEDRLP